MSFIDLLIEIIIFSFNDMEKFGVQFKDIVLDRVMMVNVGTRGWSRRTKVRSKD